MYASRYAEQPGNLLNTILNNKDLNLIF